MQKHLSIPLLTDKDRQRFWAKVRQGDGCWTWGGAKSQSGYGRFKLDGRIYLAHRIAFALTYGDSPSLSICHRCDNPSCVNPEHLWDQTPLENAREASDRDRLRQPAKPRKPSPTFPLFPHQRGYWAKKVRGKLCYFGKIADDPKGVAALQQWLDEKDYLLAGRKPRTPDDGCTVRYLCNAFITAKEQQRDAGELSPRTFDDYHKTCERLVATFGRERLVDDLQPDEFNALRAKWAKQWGVRMLSREIQQARTIFKFGYDSHLIDHPVRFGPQFKQPSKKAKRAAKQAAEAKSFEPEELRSILAKAKQPMHAMILLGLNCGYGNYDVGALPRSAVDLDAGWIDYPRHKTAIHRRCPLWPETIKSLREAIDNRPEPNDPADVGLCFITRYGNRWAHDDKADSPVSKQFRKILDDLGLHRKGVGFYTLRHVFQTIGGNSLDRDAVGFLMGHVDPSMAAEYREGIPDERLRAVVDVVHRWLFATERRAK